LVFVLDAGATARSFSERGMDADAGLDAGFLVSRQHEVAAAERCTFPATSVEVKLGRPWRANCGSREKIPLR